MLALEAQNTQTLPLVASRFMAAKVILFSLLAVVVGLAVMVGGEA
jgi:hypothetical protein